MNKKILSGFILAALSSQVMADEVVEKEVQDIQGTESEVQDMSDPLAVYTQAGFGVTNKGLNVKIGQTYDTGSDTTMGMNVIEMKGIYGEALGWDSNDKKDNSMDSIRFRNFSVDMTNGRGKQIDVNYSVESETLDASYSFIQALPKMGMVQLYPLAGVGVRAMNGEYNTDGSVDTATSGYTVPGTYGVVGLYSKVTITDKIWLNYNPMYLTSLSGSDVYQDNAFGADNSDVIAHEFAASYQIEPRLNVRYFANWSDESSFGEGDHRVELNYQF